MNDPLDARGNPIRVGDFVVYTTNDRYSALNFGTVKKIVQKPDTIYGNGNFGHHNFLVTLDKTHPDGKPKFVTEWDSETKEHRDTQVQAKSGHIQWTKYKFLVLY